MRSRVTEQNQDQLIANFSLIKKNKQYFFRDRPCEVVADVQTSPTVSKPIKSILKVGPSVLTHAQLWRSWSENMSADQLVSIIKAVNLHLLLFPENKLIYQKYSNLNYDNYLESFIKDFYMDYKRGSVTLSLSNRLHLAELCKTHHKKKISQISFNPTVKICLLNTDSCRNLMCNKQICDSKKCSKTLSDKVNNVNHKICLLCISKEESNLLIHEPT